MVHLLFSLVGAFMMLQSREAAFSCDNGPPGQYCTDDLTGYHDCGRTSNQIVACPAGTRCTCFVRNSCTVNTPDICQTFTISSPVVKNFEMRYHGSEVSSSPVSTITVSFQAHVRQNFYSKRFFKNLWKTNRTYFEIIHPTAHGKFIKYEGKYPNTCMTTILDNFPAFGPDLERHTLESSRAQGGLVEQTWKFLIGRQNLGQDLTRDTWEMLKNPTLNEMRPISNLFQIEGGAQSRFSVTRQYNVGLFFKINLGDEWFPVPIFC